jgi:hypothetical protein
MKRGTNGAHCWLRAVNLQSGAISLETTSTLLCRVSLRAYCPNGGKIYRHASLNIEPGRRAAWDSRQTKCWRYEVTNHVSSSERRLGI